MTERCPTCGSDDKDYSPDGDQFSACWCDDPWHDSPAQPERCPKCLKPMQLFPTGLQCVNWRCNNLTAYKHDSQAQPSPEPRNNETRPTGMGPTISPAPVTATPDAQAKAELLWEALKRARAAEKVVAALREENTKLWKALSKFNPQDVQEALAEEGGTDE